MRFTLAALMLIAMLAAMFVACPPERCPEPGRGKCSDLQMTV